MSSWAPHSLVVMSLCFICTHSATKWLVKAWYKTFPFKTDIWDVWRVIKIETNTKAFGIKFLSYSYPCNYRTHWFRSVNESQNNKLPQFKKTNPDEWNGWLRMTCCGRTTDVTWEWRWSTVLSIAYVGFSQITSICCLWFTTWYFENQINDCSLSNSNVDNYNDCK